MIPDFRNFEGEGMRQLMHSAKGTTWTKKNAKYTDKVKTKSGKWRYIYGESGGAKTTGKEVMSGANALLTVGEKAKNLTNNVKSNLKSAIKDNNKRLEIKAKTEANSKAYAAKKAKEQAEKIEKERLAKVNAMVEEIRRLSPNISKKGLETILTENILTETKLYENVLTETFLDENNIQTFESVSETWDKR